MELILDGVSITHHDIPILTDVMLTLRTGELVVLVGPNGAGKTTLLRAALGLVRLDRGRITLDGEDATRLAPRARASRLAWLPQTGSVSEPMTAADHVAAARYRFGESARRAEAGAFRALTRVDAGSLAERALGSLSGGERQRVAIAAVLAQEAPLLLLDEPANHLDPHQQRETFRLIAALARMGHGVLCVTHDVGALAGLAKEDSTRVVGLRSGRLAFDVPLGDATLAARLSDLFGLRLAFAERDGERALVTWWPVAEPAERPCG
ncbi:MAG: ABC transporter ATP-binding protein [Polyangiaceae bacterium]|nr:ABC transporter ATP-binding protein [Polyangiaceae bacterium]